MELFASDFSDFEKILTFHDGAILAHGVRCTPKRHRPEEVEQRVRATEKATEGDGRLRDAAGQTDAAAPAAPEG